MIGVKLLPRLFSEIPLIFALVFYFNSYNVSAQLTYTVLSGKVMDRESKEPLPFASIYVKGETIGTTSSLDGSFIFNIPTDITSKSVVISMIGYQTIEKLSTEFVTNEHILLNSSTLELKEVIVTSDKPLTARQIVKLAYEAIPVNYPSEPYILEGFIRDLEKEDDSYVELLEYAAKFSYAGYKYYPKVELQEVRKSYETEKHSWNDANEQQNSINDLLEDDFVKYGFSFLRGTSRWKYEVESVLPFNSGAVYKIVGTNKPFEKVVLYIDVDSYAFVKIELERSKTNGRYYKRRFTNGQQESHYNMVFEYQKVNGKMYLKYQKEEDIWQIFKGLESKKMLFTKYYEKELFINAVIPTGLESYPFEQNLKTTKSIEEQAKPYNPDFWKHYNAPALTLSDSKILKDLEKANIKVK